MMREREEYYRLPRRRGAMLVRWILVAVVVIVALIFGIPFFRL